MPQDLDLLAMREGLHAAGAALHLLRALAHVVALVAVAGEHFAAAGDLESLLGPGLGLHLGHFLLLVGWAARRRLRSGWACPGPPANAGPSRGRSLRRRLIAVR